MSIKRFQKRSFIAVAAAVFLLTSAACSSGGNDNEASSEPSATEQASASASAPASESQASESGAVSTDPFAKYDPPIVIKAGRKSRPNIKFVDGEDYTNNAYTKFVKDKLGIEVQYDWIVDESQYETKVNLAIASNDIPDIFIVNAAQEQQLIEAGMILDITDLFEQYASPLMKKIVSENPDLYKTVLTNSRLYDIPFMPSFDYKMNDLTLRKDWMDKLGLTPPKTTAEFWNVIDAFVNKDPDGNGKKDTIGLSLNKDLTTDAVGVGDIGPLFHMYNAYPGIWTKDASGKLVYGSILPEMKAALQNMQDMFKKGLIDPEFAVKDQGKVAQDIVAEKSGAEFGVFWTPAYPWHDVYKKNNKLELYNLDIPSLDGTTSVKQGVTLQPLSKLVISKKAKNPEAIIKVVGLSEEMWWGSSDIAKEWNAIKSDPKYKDVGGVDTNIPLMFMEPSTLNYDLLKEVTDAVNAEDPNLATTTEGRSEYDTIMKFVKDKDPNGWGLWALRVGPNSSQAIDNMRQDKKAYIVSEFFGPPGPVATEKSSTLNKMFLEMVTKIIMGAAPVSDFDKFVEQWKASGGDDLTAEINAWYDQNK